MHPRICHENKIDSRMLISKETRKLENKISKVIASTIRRISTAMNYNVVFQGKMEETGYR